MHARSWFLFCCLTGFILAGCNDKKKDPEKTNSIQAKINGALWSPSSVNCTLLIDTTYDFRIVDFSASSSGKTITMEARDNATGSAMNTGTRSYAAGSAYFGYNITGSVYHTISGSINIESVEASAMQVTGSFEFTLEDDIGNQVVVSDGRFVKVSYAVKTQ